MSKDASFESLGRDVAKALGPWFLAAHRDMAWRRTRDPYAIWVSEIMLQQTRVDTVARYFPTFVERFPNVEALAAADEDAVLQAWSGLGYYRRARLLHRGAQVVARDFQGRIPRDAPALRTIPGVGAYTAGAIASIAFDEPAALVDGNVARVFSRLRGVADPKGQGADAKAHWALAQSVVEHGSPRVLAQALMELGAVVCTPRTPRCEVCPIAPLCVARTEGATTVIPAPRRKAPQPLESWAALAITVSRKLMLQRRPEEGLLAGLWCLPLVPLRDDVPDPEAVRAILGEGIGPWHPRGTPVRHVFTHKRWELRVFEASARRRPKVAGSCWLLAGERPGGGVPSVAEKLLAALAW